MISMSKVHSASLRLLRRTTSIIRYEWRKNLIFKKVTETTHTSRFMMILMSLVHFATFRVVRRTTNFLYYESLDNSIFQRVPWRFELAASMMISMSVVHSARLHLLTTHNEYNPLWVTEEHNFSESSRHNSFDVLSTFWKLTSSTTHNKYSVMSEGGTQCFCKCRRQLIRPVLW